MLNGQLPEDKVSRFVQLGLVIEELYDATENKITQLSTKLITLFQFKKKYIRNIVDNMFQISRRRFNISKILSKILYFVTEFSTEFKQLIEAELLVHVNPLDLFFLHFCCRENLVPLPQLKIALKDYLLDHNRTYWSREMLFFLGQFFYRSETKFYFEQLELIKKGSYYNTYKFYFDHLEEFKSNDFSLLEHVIEYGDKPDSLRSIILHDDFESFYKYTLSNSYIIDPKERLSSFFIDPEYRVYGIYDIISAIQFSGSIKIYRYLKLQNPKITNFLDSFSIQGGSIEIIKDISFQKNIARKWLSESILFHRPIIYEWLCEKTCEHIANVNSIASGNNFLFLIDQKYKKNILYGKKDFSIICYSNEYFLCYIYASCVENGMITQIIRSDLHIAFDEYLKRNPVEKGFMNLIIENKSRKCFEIIKKFNVDLSPEVTTKEITRNSAIPEVVTGLDLATLRNVEVLCYPKIKEKVFLSYHYYMKAYECQFYSAFIYLCSKADFSDFQPEFFKGVTYPYYRILELYGAPVSSIQTYHRKPYL